MTGEEKLAAAIELLGDEGDAAIKFDGLEDAIVGVARQYTKEPLLVYDERLIIDHFMDAEEMTEEEAWDWYGFNVADLWAGEGTPLIMRRIE